MVLELCLLYKSSEDVSQLQYLNNPIFLECTQDITMPFNSVKILCPDFCQFTMWHIIAFNSVRIDFADLIRVITGGIVLNRNCSFVISLILCFVNSYRARILLFLAEKQR